MRLESNAAQHLDMQGDARRAFVEQFARRITPEHRPAGRVRTLLAATWMLVLVCGGAAAGLATLFAVTPSLRQLVVDTALALGAGTPVENAEVTGLRCQRQSYGGRLRMVETACTLTLMQDGTRLRLELHGTGEITRDDIRGLRRLGSTLGAVWSPEGMLGRWLNVVPMLFVLALTAAIAILAARSLPRQHRHLRILREGADAGSFAVDDVPLTAMAIIQMTTGVIVWFRPDERLSVSELADTYHELTMRLVGARKDREDVHVRSRNELRAW